MRHSNSVDKDRYALDTRKGKMSMKQAVAPYLERLAALNAQREADRINASVNWIGKEKE